MTQQLDAAVDEREPLDPRLVRRIVVGLMLGVFVGAMDNLIIATALPTIVGELGGLDQIAWTTTAYAITTTAVTPLYGKLADVFGRRPVYIVGIVLFLIGSIACGFAQNMVWLIIARCVQGLGGGGLIGIAQIVIGDIVAPRDRTKYQGAIGSMAAAAALVGPAVGGLVTEYISWRWVFYINIPIGIIALLITASVLKYVPHVPRPRRIDVLGALLLVAFVTTLVTGLFRLPTSGFLDPLTLGLLIGGILLAGAFSIRQLSAREPIMSFSLFRIPNFRWTTIAGFCIGLSSAGVVLYTPLVLQTVKGLSVAESGLFFIPETLALLVMNIVAGRLVGRTGHYKFLLLTGLSLITIALLTLALLPQDASALWIGVGVVIFGAGIGCTTPITMLIVQNSVPADELGVGTSTLSFSRSMGTTFGLAIYGTIAAAYFSANPSLISVSPADLARMPASVAAAAATLVHQAVSSTFLVAAPVALVGLGFAFLVHEVVLRGRKIPIAAQPLIPENPETQS